MRYWMRWWMRYWNNISSTPSLYKGIGWLVFTNDKENLKPDTAIAMIIGQIRQRALSWNWTNTDSQWKQTIRRLKAADLLHPTVHRKKDCRDSLHCRCIALCSFCSVRRDMVERGTGAKHYGWTIEFFTDEDLLQTYVNLLSTTFVLTADSILLEFAHSYLKFEQEEGTPFTEKGAERLKKLGFHCIYIQS